MKTFFLCLAALPLMAATFQPKEETLLGFQLKEATVTIAGAEDGKLSVKAEPKTPEAQHIEKADEELIRFVSEGEEEKWTVTMGQTVPVDLEVNLGKGRVDLDVSNTGIRDLFVDGGSGVLNVTGDGSTLDDVELKQDEGLIAFELKGDNPKLDAIEMDGGQGLVRLELVGTFPELGKVVMEAGAGDVEAKLTGKFERLQELTFKTTSGSLTLDLTGDWTFPANMEVETTRGNVKVALPHDVGVLVKPSSATGEIHSEGLWQTQQGWVNPAYAKAPVSLELEIKTLSGNIDLVVNSPPDQKE